MKTKTFILICLFLCFGITKISAQTEVYKFSPVGGAFPVTCDGINIFVLDCTASLTFLVHKQGGRVVWVDGIFNWTATNSSTGEVFKGREQDKGYYHYDSEGNWILETGTWHAVIIGNQGNHYNITFSYSFDGVNWSFEFVEAKCH